MPDSLPAPPPVSATPRKPRAPRRRPVPVTPEMLEGAPEFAPVPRKFDRFDGWSYDRQRAFIKRLAETGGIRRAADYVGMSEVGAYQLRKAEGAEGFCQAWDEALAIGVSRLADIAFDRAVNGVPVPIVYKGEIVGEKRVYNDRLMTWHLRHHDPERYGEGHGRGDGASPTVKKRIRAEAQVEIDALGEEVRMLRDFVAEEIERKELIARLADKLMLMGSRMRGEPDKYAAKADDMRDDAARLREWFDAACPPARGPGLPPVPVDLPPTRPPDPDDWLLAIPHEEPTIPGLLGEPSEEEMAADAATGDGAADGAGPPEPDA